MNIVKYKKLYIFVTLFFILANLLIFTSGCGIGWTSPVFSRLYSNDTTENPLGEPINQLQESLIAGLPFLGSLIGPIFASKPIDIYGRKKILGIFGAIQIFSFILLALCANIWIYYFCRFLYGLCFSVIGPVLAIYTSEISSRDNRGRYGSIFALFIPLGNLYAFSVGAVTPVRLFSFLCATPCLISIPFFLAFVPDSPVFLASVGNIKDARGALQKFRNHEAVNDELEQILLVVNNNDNAEKTDFISILQNRVVQKGLIITIGINFFQIFTGMPALMTFLGPIFDTVNTGMSGNVTAILVAIVKVSTFTFIATVIEKFNRRTLLLLSETLIGLCLFVLGTYFYLKTSGITSNIDRQISWIPIAAILLYMIGFAVGIGTLPLILVGEVFPNNCKSVAVACVILVITTTSFIVTFSFRYIAYYLGLYLVIWIFCGFCVIGAAFVYFLVPETKGKCLLEIQDMLAKSR